MAKFVVMYRVPVETMKEWKKNTPPDEMKKQNDKLGADMDAWTKKNKKNIIDNGLPLGKTKRMTAKKADDIMVEDVVNDLNYYCVIEAKSANEVADMFSDNPHFQIPTAYIDIMEVSENSMN